MDERGRHPAERKEKISGRPRKVPALAAALCAVLALASGPAGAAAPDFAEERSYGVGSDPTSIAAADLDGDGDRDLAATNNRDEAPGRISVLKNRGDGIYSKPNAYDAGAVAPGSIAAADFDRDRGPDLAVNSFTNARISVLANRGNGAFGKVAAYRTGRYPSDIVAADLGGSGRPDLAVVNSGPDTVSVLINATRGRTAGPWRGVRYVDAPPRVMEPWS